MNNPGLVGRLQQLQQILLSLTAPLSDAECRRQYHADLSPVGWHVGHAIFIEDLWLHEETLNAGERSLYLPENNVKAGRGPRLPDKETLLDETRRRQRANIRLLKAPPDALAGHPLMKDGYLLKFLVQHHAQHIETMRMALTQRQLALCREHDHVGGLAQAAPVHRRAMRVEAGEYEIGGRDNWSFDNELPRHDRKMKGFSIHRAAVTNAEYLGFIESGGYRKDAHWDAAGLRWRRAAACQAPDGWLRGRDGWFEATCDGVRVLAPDAPVHGLSHFEARAFSRYADARLPCEYEWETACAQGCFDNDGQAWEWCANAFHPYDGFRAFPYNEYSAPWFDGAHYTLRGASAFSETDCKRPSFRNFHAPDKRHIFAGLRLAFD